jgi:hypothetical protein
MSGSVSDDDAVMLDGMAPETVDDSDDDDGIIMLDGAPQHPVVAAVPQPARGRPSNQEMLHFAEEQRVALIKLSWREETQESHATLMLQPSASRRTVSGVKAPSNFEL